MNIENSTQLPNLQLGKFKCLVDSGSTRSFINSRIIQENKSEFQIFNENFTLSTAHGISKGNNYTNIYFDNVPIKFYVFDFHTQFDILLGLEDLKILKAKYDIVNDRIYLLGHEYKLNYNSNKINLQPKEAKLVSYFVNEEDSDVLLENNNINSHFKIPDSIVRIKDKKLTVPLINRTDKEIEICNLNIPNFTKNFQIKNPPQEPIDLSNFRTDHLNEIEKEKLIKVIQEYRDIFYNENNKLTFTNEIKHDIKTYDEIPVHTKTYRYPNCYKDEVQTQIKKLLEDDIIRHSYSPWSSPVWIVPKKPDASGKKKFRMVIDYRKLNEKTIDDKYPIPNINDILDKLGRCKYFTTLDLVSGYHQIEVTPNDIPKTAFNVENGHYEFTRMPFGLKNARSTFQRLMY